MAGPAKILAAVLANLVVLSAVIFAWLAAGSHPDFYYQSVQEDEFIEWGTFWGFMLAMAAFLWSAWRQRKTTGKIPWFLAGVGLFCFLFAMEEISWGQRVLSYRPPELFLRDNFQQEFNYHNLIDTSLRKLLLKLIIAGYGVVLPLLALFRPLKRWMDRLAIVGPSPVLIPAFAAAYWVYSDYPWEFSGEIVEVTLAVGFLSAGLLLLWDYLGPLSAVKQSLGLAGAGILVLTLGVAHTWVSKHLYTAPPEMIEQTKLEVEALKRDFLTMAMHRGRRLATNCGLHKRLFTYVQQYDRKELRQGVFAQLKRKGVPEERVDYFLDPWNSPYWIRHRCENRRRRIRVFVYSFGPNRRRDSTPMEIKGDDIGAYIFIRDVPVN